MAVSDPLSSETYRMIASQPAWNRYKTIVELLAKHTVPGARVADIGAWPGQLSRWLRQLGWSVVAVDKEPERPITWDVNWWHKDRADASDTFKSLCEKEGIEVAAANIEKDPLPIETNSLDAVILTEVIEHLWGNPLHTLSEINRVLKAETGLLILSTPNLTSLRNRLNFALGHIERVIEHPFVSFLKVKRLGHCGHLRLYSPKELVTLLHLLGFQPTVQFAVGMDYLGYAQRPAANQATPANQALPANQATGAKSPASSRVPRLVKKLIRSPKGYWSATCATLLALAEKCVPSFRSQLFITARKVRDADFDKNYSAEVENLVWHNTTEPSRS
jgi:SAM-dependent methyltransferase